MLESKTNLMVRVETLLDEEIVKFFRFEYVQRGLTMRQISNKILKLTGILIKPGVLSRWFKILGIPTRKLEWRATHNE